MPGRILTVPTHYYQHFDNDPTLDVPAEGQGGWTSADLPLDLDHTALVVMHAWDTGRQSDVPGWFRAVEYLPRSEEIAATILPKTLAAARAAGLPVFHVTGWGGFYQSYPGHQRARGLAGDDPPEPARVERDPVAQELAEYRTAHVFPGTRNQPDIARGRGTMGIYPGATPLGDEGVAEGTHQLLALCREHQISHLIYTGFAINACLLMSPGGMVDMSRHGILCSAVRQCVTAVENKHTARTEGAKELALWGVSVFFGYVYDVDELIAALAQS